jgi:hypothetical protein
MNSVGVFRQYISPSSCLDATLLPNHSRYTPTQSRNRKLTLLNRGVLHGQPAP